VARSGECVRAEAEDGDFSPVAVVFERSGKPVAQFAQGPGSIFDIRPGRAGSIRSLSAVTIISRTVAVCRSPAVVGVARGDQGTSILLEDFWVPALKPSRLESSFLCGDVAHGGDCSKGDTIPVR